MTDNKKVLVLSISAWNSRVGADTWPTLVSGMNPDNIASISLREETPDSLACNNYFVLSENKVLKSIFNRKIKTGRKIESCVLVEDENKDLSEHNKRYQKMGRKRNLLGLIAREMVWMLGKWKTTELDKFITDFSPDIILYSMDGYIHFNRLCRYAKKITSAKSIGFFWDDNFTYKQSSRFGLRVFRFLQRKSLKKLAKQTDAFWAITDMTKKEADDCFNIDCTVITKPIQREMGEIAYSIEKPINLLYTGNLQIGREHSLVRVVNAIKKIGAEKDFVVDIYTKTVLDENIKKQLDCDFCSLHDPVTQNEVLALQKKADVLLFLEAIDGENAHTARLSFSTKITDYLSSGKCIFAIGCADTAPMQYFIQNNAAITATNDGQIENSLREIIKDTEILTSYAEKAREIGIKNHSKDVVLKAVEKSICDTLGV
ncbi:MAG: hypothetical protein IKW45_03145 [Clostridia bacterium]|nr:hypothetical protein [Clostridia bacterium]